MRAQVLNNCQGPHYIQGQNSNGKKPPLLILRPGLNLVESKQLAEWRKANSSFDGLFKAKVKPSRAETADPRKFGKPMLEVVGKELDDTAPLAKLSLEEAAGVIALTEDTDLLNEWMKTAKPADPVVKVISDRLKEITSGIAA